MPLICSIGADVRQSRIGAEYLAAFAQPFSGHPLAKFIRGGAPEAVAHGLNDPSLLIQGSPGKGTWTYVPWLAVFNPLVTKSAQEGHYVVYLYSADMNRLYLSMNQGTTRLHNEFGPGYLEELKRRAAVMAARVPEYVEHFTNTPIELTSAATLPIAYQAGHAFGAAYDLANLPNKEHLQTDLRRIAELYLMITARGGSETLSDDEEIETPDEPLSLEERRKYRYHRRIERNGALIKEVKKVQGFTCAVCSFDFEKIYGEIGKEFIEAHHLVPISELPEGKTVSLNPKDDFAVLCSNCHRMVHRKKIPIAPKTLRAYPGLKKVRGLFPEKD
jgi:5-methylcytosine-specific restriction enzyme A